MELRWMCIDQSRSKQN